jgi:hypothetical protein
MDREEKISSGFEEQSLPIAIAESNDLWDQSLQFSMTGERGHQPNIISRCQLPERIKTQVKVGMGLGIVRIMRI